MRVLVVSAFVPWRVQDGASLVLHHQLKRWSARHEIRLIAPGAPAQEAEPRSGEEALPAGVEIRWLGTRLPRQIDYPIRWLRSAWSGEPLLVSQVERRLLVRRLRETLARHRPQILHLHGWGTAQITRFAPGLPSVHVPIDAWGLGVANRPLPRWRRIAERKEPARVRAHEARHYPACGAIVVVTSFDANYIRSTAPGARVEVVPNGVEPGAEPGPPTPEPVLGFHGAFETVANCDAAEVLAREIFPLIRSRVPGARLLLIGRDPGPRITSLAGDGIEVTGTVPDVRPMLERVAVYVAPMVSGSGIKNKVLEAMAAGLPIVASPRATEGIGPGPGMIVAGDVAALADESVRLLSSAEERRVMGAEARARVMRNFTWEQNAREIEALWAGLAR